MPNYSKEFLSQSAGGRAIPITGTGSNLTVIHNTPVSTGVKDEVWIYGSNVSNQDIFVAIDIGNPTGISPSEVVFTGVIEAYAGNVLMCPGFLVAGNGSTATSVAAVASVASGVNIIGYVNRIS